MSLTAARAAKNDEFYTQYCDIEAEMNAYVEHDPDVFRDRVVLCPCDDPEWSNFTRYFAANFDHLGLRKLISTSYARGAANRQPTLFESASPAYDESLHDAHGRIYVLDRDSNEDGRIDLDDLSFSYLEGDGDFRSDEVTRLRDEADVIVTNPPFSLFREFLAWVMEGGKRFAMIGNQNAITYKEVFPLLRNNEVWLGTTHPKRFRVPEDADHDKVTYVDGVPYQQFGNVLWFTNLDYGARHEPLQLMDMRQNLKFNKRLRKKLERDYGSLVYPRYDNYDAIEVPFTECIPSDYRPGFLVPVRYRDTLSANGFSLGAELPNSAGEPCVLVYDGLGWDASEIGRGGVPPCLLRLVPEPEVELTRGVMGVPITFLDKYSPEQFEIVDANDCRRDSRTRHKPHGLIKDKEGSVANHTCTTYARILIRHKTSNGATA